MPLTVPNLPTIIAAGGSAEQAEPDAVDFEILGDERFGVISGGVLTQQVSPGMTMAMTAAVVVVDGAIYSISGGNVSFTTADAYPRYDLVVAKAGAFQVVKGAAAANAVAPVWDHASTVLWAVYIVPGTTGLLTPMAVDKRRVVEPVLRRRSAAATDPQIDFGTFAGGSLFSIDTSGKISWENGSSDITMQHATQDVLSVFGELLVQTLNAAVPTLVAKALASQTASLQEWQNSSGTAIAKIGADGEFTALNFRTGTGSPEGVVAAPQGSLYTDKAGDPATGSVALYVKDSGVATNIGWSKVAAYDPIDPMPIGAIVGWYKGTTPPKYVEFNGGVINSATYATLADAAHWNFSGNFTMPDFRGRFLVANLPGSAHFDATAALTGGLEYVTLTGGQLPVWTPTLSIAQYNHSHGGVVYTNGVGDHYHQWYLGDAFGSYQGYNPTVVMQRTGASNNSVATTTGGLYADNVGYVTANTRGAGSHSHYAYVSDDGHAHAGSSVTNWPGANQQHENTPPYHRISAWLVKAL